MKAEVIYGPPGTGKTTYLVNRVKSYQQERVGVVSFTKAAAKEIADRCGIPAGREISTLHSYGYRLAGLSKEQVINDSWLRELTKVIGIQFSSVNSYEITEMTKGQAYMSLYSLARAKLTTDYRGVFMECPEVGALHEFIYFVESYESFKKAYGVVDFSDMLDLAVGEDPEVDILVVDEAQDLTPQQWRLVESWIPFLKEIIIAGDDDQSIYKWNGADPSGMPDFEIRHGAKRVVLDQSFRIPSSVHDLATDLISNVSDRVEKEYRPKADKGVINRYGDIRMVDTPTGETMILVRNHSIREDIEEWLVSRGVAYTADGGKPAPLSSRQANAVRVWCKYQQNMANTGLDMLSDKEWNALERAVKPVYRDKVKRRVEIKKSWEQVLDLKPDLISYLKRIFESHGCLPKSTDVRICTIHASKGKEANRIILVNGMGQRTYESKERDSEIRTFYVAVTRAKERLDIVMGSNPLRELI
jgi:superfamily I DNA/RNA helicase